MAGGEGKEEWNVTCREMGWVGRDGIQRVVQTVWERTGQDGT